MFRNRNNSDLGHSAASQKNKKRTGYYTCFIYGIPYTRTYTEFRGIPRTWTVKNFVELREIKPIPYKIPYSAEFQNGTSENTLVQRLSNNGIEVDI